MNEFIGKLQEATKLDLSTVRLNGINIMSKSDTLEIVLLCPKEDENNIKSNLLTIAEHSTKILKTTFNVKIKIKRSYFDEGTFTYSLLGFFDNYPLIRRNIKSGNFEFKYEDDKIIVILSMPQPIVDYIESRKITSDINNFIFNNYCEKIIVQLFANEVNEEITEEDTIHYVYDHDGGRTIKITEVLPLIGNPINQIPGYIVDARPCENIVLCGKVKNFTEYKRKIEEGDTVQKYTFKFKLEDFTGEVQCVYFSSDKSKNLEKIQMLSDGKEVVVSGVLELNTFKGATNLSLRVKYISICKLPDDFTLNRIRMVVPAEYKKVIPMPYEDYTQDNMFSVKEAPSEYLLDKSFVVFDIETTGLIPTMDKIIEIGAVKIKNGVICESFSTLIDPERTIPQKIVELTGITDEAVRGSPLLTDVMPDFYKFCHGCIMVGQNSIAFDYPFVKSKAEAMNIYLDNEQLDVMLLAQKYYPHLPRYSLDYLSKYFDIKNERAHRAVHDAETTAKIFIKIAKNLT